MMSELQAVKALVAERLAAAAEEILSAVEEKLLHTSDMPPEQQRAAVHKRLAVVAEEIFRILEIMMGKYEAEVSSSHKESERQSQLLDITLKAEAIVQRADKLPLSGSDCEKDVSSEQSRSSSQLQKTSNPPQVKDASTETDCRPSHLRQMHRAEKGTSTMMETETPPPSDKVLSSNNSGAASEDNENALNEKPLKSNKRYKSQGEDCCRMCGRSFHKSVPGKNKKTCERNISITNKSQTTGQSCCRVCGKFFRYKRSFLKHVLAHEQSSDVCGACGKLLDTDESLKAHLQTHNEENICRDQTDDKRSEAEGSDAESKVGDSDEEWKDSEASDSDEGDSAKDETKGRRCAQKSKTKASNKPKNKDYKDSSHLKYSCKVCGKPFCYRASFLKHVQEDEGDTDLCDNSSGQC
ncbi:hypothetical protein PFLUV_G00240570 [Perca fluviatilis]|uniref:C2H2-type domain-containing protein n=1 Tax=Perca fluviatilis TaxID=8168 RepID=A0A6A5E5U6_PERFL|nr:hypothetical protein PFLUV_G00240570 [Perca fluviatilis]